MLCLGASGLGTPCCGSSGVRGLSSKGLMLCSMALQSTALRSCNECKTMQLRLFSKSPDDPTPRRYSRCCTGCPFNSKSSIKYPCWHSRSAAHRHCCTFDAWSRIGSTSTTYDPPPRRCLSHRQGWRLWSALSAAQRLTSGTRSQRQS